MSSRWLIAADDLTGAADCAIAFTKSGTPAAVIWGKGSANAPVVSANIESRAMSPSDARHAHRETLLRLWSPETRLYKKIDSTVRGQPAAELAETITFLKEKNAGALAVVCPAFPGTGRTTENGSIKVQGQPLEETPLWARDHTYKSAHLPSLLAEADLSADTIPLEELRRGAQTLGPRIEAALKRGCAALVCDAVTEADLDIIAAATLPRATDLFWVGSGGLAAALARAGDTRQALQAPRLSERRGGILIAVGSLAEVSRTAARELAASGSVRHALIEPDVILARNSAPLDSIAASIVADLQAGRDVLVEVALAATPDLSLGTRLMSNLAAALSPAGDVISGLIATGGDTAVALLDCFGVNGIELFEEIESGIPLGRSLGRVSVPVVTKAGAFGSPATLLNALNRIRSLTA